VLGSYEDGAPALVRHGRALYLATLTDDALLAALFTALAAEAGIAVSPVSGGLRLRRRGNLTFAINYGDLPVTAPGPPGADFMLGERRVGARDLAIWKDP